MEGLIDYSRQAEFDQTLTGISKTQVNYIVGCGGVGFWLGIILAMQGCTNFMLIDGQAIERSNLNRLPVPPSWVGVNKAIALRKVIRGIRPLTAVHVITEHITPETFNVFQASGSTVRLGSKGCFKTLWDCTDDARIQKLIFKALKKGASQVHYRKLGYEGFQVGSYREYDVWVPADYTPGYRTSNACAATSALAAVLGIVSEGMGRTEDLEVNIKQLVESGRVHTTEDEDEEEEAMEHL